jgi:hypothetical protein
MKKYILILFLLAAGSVSIYTQTDSLSTSWKTKEDFEAAEGNVKKFILWLQTNTPSQDKDLRKTVSAYVLKWFVDCPYISISVDEKFELLKSGYTYEPDMLGIYMFGIGYYLIEHKNEKMGLKSVYAGYKAMLALYDTILKSEPSATNKQLDEYKKLESSSELKSYIKDKYY